MQYSGIIENPGLIENDHIIAIPPGETVKELLCYRNMSQKEFAIRMQLSEKHICNLLNGAVLLTTDVALKLETILGPPASFWEGLEASYREKIIQIKNEEEMVNEQDLLNQLPYSKMSHNGWVPDTNNYYEKVLNSRKFFEVMSLQLIFDPRINKLSSFHDLEEKDNLVSFIAWAQKAKLLSREIETGSFNVKKLTKILPELKTLCSMPQKKSIPLLKEKLADCGIALVLLPTLDKSYVHGATFNDNGKVVIALTNEDKTNEQFWLSLFHEFGHIINGDINLKNELSDDFEEKADKFAIDYFVDCNGESILIEVNKKSSSIVQTYAEYLKTTYLFKKGQR